MKNGRNNKVQRGAGVIAVAMVSLALPGVGAGARAMGQEKPPPTPIQVNDQLPSVNVRAWRDANKRLGRPKWLVLAGLATPTHQGVGDPGSTLFNLDQTGITQQLRTSLQEELNLPEADVRFVQFDALKTSITRLRGVLDTRGERDALKLLGDDLGVRQALIVRVHTFVNGNPEKVTVESMDLARGEAGYSLAFDWKFGTSARDIKDYAKGLAARFVDDFAARADMRPTRVEVRVFGLDSPEDIRAARRAIRSVEGVEQVERGSGASGRADSFVTYEVTLEKGATETDVGEELPIALGDVLKRGVEVVKDEGGGMALRVGGASAGAGYAGSRDEMRDCVSNILDRDNPRAKKFVDELRATYKAQNEPTVAVLVNRRPVTKHELDQARGAGLSGTNVVVVQNGVNSMSGAPAGTGTTTDDEFRAISSLNTVNQTLEGLIYKRLGPEGVDFRRTDGASARAKMQQALDLSKGFTDDGQVLKFIQDGSMAAYVIVGTGTLTIDGGRIEARYEFRMIGKDSALVAVAPQVLGRVLLDGPIATSTELERMADEAVSQLLCEFVREGRHAAGGVAKP